MSQSALIATLSLLGITGPFSNLEGTQLNTQLKEIIRSRGASHLLGSSDADITQWLSIAQSISLLGSDVALKNMCLKINASLRSRSYCVASSLTLADAALFNAIASSAHFSQGVLSECADLVRWMNHISTICTGSAFVTCPVAPTVFPVRTAKGKAEAGASVPSSSEDTAAAVPAPAAKKLKAAEPKPAAAAEAATEVLDPSKLDIRVGLVTKCWEHPESDKLYCEEIDLGESTVRSIASGLRAFYSSASDIQGRMVLVLANLKERPLAGFKSQVCLYVLF